MSSSEPLVHQGPKEPSLSLSVSTATQEALASNSELMKAAPQLFGEIDLSVPAPVQRSINLQNKLQQFQAQGQKGGLNLKLQQSQMSTSMGMGMNSGNGFWWSLQQQQPIQWVNALWQANINPAQQMNLNMMSQQLQQPQLFNQQQHFPQQVTAANQFQQQMLQRQQQMQHQYQQNLNPNSQLQQIVNQQSVSKGSIVSSQDCYSETEDSQSYSVSESCSYSWSQSQSVSGSVYSNSHSGSISQQGLQQQNQRSKQQPFQQQSASRWNRNGQNSTNSMQSKKPTMNFNPKSRVLGQGGSGGSEQPQQQRRRFSRKPPLDNGCMSASLGRLQQKSHGMGMGMLSRWASGKPPPQPKSSLANAAARGNMQLMQGQGQGQLLRQGLQQGSATQQGQNVFQGAGQQSQDGVPPQQLQVDQQQQQPRHLQQPQLQQPAQTQQMPFMSNSLGFNVPWVQMYNQQQPQPQQGGAFGMGLKQQNQLGITMQQMQQPVMSNQPQVQGQKQNNTSNAISSVPLPFKVQNFNMSPQFNSRMGQSWQKYPNPKQQQMQIQSGPTQQQSDAGDGASQASQDNAQQQPNAQAQFQQQTQQQPPHLQQQWKMQQQSQSSMQMPMQRSPQLQQAVSRQMSVPLGVSTSARSRALGAPWGLQVHLPQFSVGLSMGSLGLGGVSWGQQFQNGVDDEKQKIVRFKSLSVSPWGSPAGGTSRDYNNQSQQGGVLKLIGDEAFGNQQVAVQSQQDIYPQQQATHEQKNDSDNNTNQNINNDATIAPSSANKRSRTDSKLRQPQIKVQRQTQQNQTHQTRMRSASPRSLNLWQTQRSVTTPRKERPVHSSASAAASSCKSPNTVGLVDSNGKPLKTKSFLRKNQGAQPTPNLNQKPKTLKVSSQQQSAAKSHSHRDSQKNKSPSPTRYWQDGKLGKTTDSLSPSMNKDKKQGGSTNKNKEDEQKKPEAVQDEIDENPKDLQEATPEKQTETKKNETKLATKSPGTQKRRLQELERLLAEKDRQIQELRQSTDFKPVNHDEGVEEQDQQSVKDDPVQPSNTLETVDKMLDDLINSRKQNLQQLSSNSTNANHQANANVQAQSQNQPFLQTASNLQTAIKSASEELSNIRKSSSATVTPVSWVATSEWQELYLSSQSKLQQKSFQVMQGQLQSAGVQVVNVPAANVEVVSGNMGVTNSGRKQYVNASAKNQQQNCNEKDQIHEAHQGQSGQDVPPISSASQHSRNHSTITNALAHDLNLGLSPPVLVSDQDFDDAGTEQQKQNLNNFVSPVKCGLQKMETRPQDSVEKNFLQSQQQKQNVDTTVTSKDSTNVKIQKETQPQVKRATTTSVKPNKVKKSGVLPMPIGLQSPQLSMLRQSPGFQSRSKGSTSVSTGVSHPQVKYSRNTMPVPGRPPQMISVANNASAQNSNSSKQTSSSNASSNQSQSQASSNQYKVGFSKQSQLKIGQGLGLHMQLKQIHNKPVDLQTLKLKLRASPSLQSVQNQNSNNTTSQINRKPSPTSGATASIRSPSLQLMNMRNMLIPTSPKTSALNTQSPNTNNSMNAIHMNIARISQKINVSPAQLQQQNQYQRQYQQRQTSKSSSGTGASALDLSTRTMSPQSIQPRPSQQDQQGTAQNQPQVQGQQQSSQNQNNKSQQGVTQSQTQSQQQQQLHQLLRKQIFVQQQLQHGQGFHAGLKAHGSATNSTEISTSASKEVLDQQSTDQSESVSTAVAI